MTDEFSRQASMEKDLGIPTTLFAAPVREIVALGKSQIGFMNMFAIPLFQGVTDVMPGMEYCVEELHKNKTAWEEEIAREQRQQRAGRTETLRAHGTESPRTLSIEPAGARNGSPAAAAGNLRMQAIAHDHSPSKEADGWPLRDDHDASTVGTTPCASTSSESLSPGSIASPTSLPPRSAKPSQLTFGATMTSPLASVHDAGRTLDGSTSPAHDQVAESSTSTIADLSSSPSKRPSGHTHSTSSKQRSSDSTTEGSSSVSAYWTDSAALVGSKDKMPLSPSTQATSFVSDVDHEDAEDTDDGLSTSQHHMSIRPRSSQAPPTSHPNDSSQQQYEAKRPHTSQPATPTSYTTPTSTTPSSPHEHPEWERDKDKDKEKDNAGMLDTVRSLKKRPSRFKMKTAGLHFWKRSPKRPVQPGLPSTEQQEHSASKVDC